MTADRDAWLARRRSGLGGSDVAGVLGLSPWESPYSIWRSKVTETPGKDVTDAMEFGTRSEPMLGKWFEDRAGLWVRGEQTECTHPEHPWMKCTVDGFVFEWRDDFTDLAGALGVAEWKTTGDSAAEWEQQIPTHYACQATWTLAVTGMERVWFGVLHLAFGRPQFRTYVFERDATDEQYVVETCEAFWRDHVVTGIAPPVDAHDATTQAIKDRWPTAEGSVDADDAARQLVSRLNAHKAMAKLTEANIVRAENELRVLLGEREALVDGVTPKGKPNVIASWKTSERTNLDLAGLRASWPDICRDFERTTTTRTLRVKPPKGE